MTMVKRRPMPTIGEIETIVPYIKSLKAIRFQKEELAKIVRKDAFGYLEAGRGEGQPIGGKFPLSFESDDELEKFKALWVSLLDDREGVVLKTLADIGVTE